MADVLQNKVTCFAPAKINLALHVTGQREDGYHLLDSLVVFADFGDKITIHSSSDSPRGEIQCGFDGLFGKKLKHALAANDNHLILKTVEHFQQSHGFLENGISIHIEKALPIASGIGGGSADAAATLLALARLYDGIPFSDLLATGEIQGADVPMCLYSQSLMARGIGTEIRLVERMPRLHLLLVNPRIEISTPMIFKSLSSKNNAPMSPLPSPLTFANLIDWLGCQRNDLEPAAIALAPQISNVLDALLQSNAMFSRMSGSGATCFGFFESAQACKTAADTIRRAYPHWWVEPTQSTDHGPDRAEIT